MHSWCKCAGAVAKIRRSSRIRQKTTIGDFKDKSIAIRAPIQRGAVEHHCSVYLANREAGPGDVAIRGRPEVVEDSFGPVRIGSGRRRELEHSAQIKTASIR